MYDNNLQESAELFRVLSLCAYCAIIATPILLAVVCGHLGSLRNELRGWKG